MKDVEAREDDGDDDKGEGGGGGGRGGGGEVAGARAPKRSCHKSNVTSSIHLDLKSGHPSSLDNTFLGNKMEI